MVTDNTAVILSAIEQVHDSQKQLDERVTAVLSDQEERIRGLEAFATSARAIGTAMGALLAFFGWDSMRHHITLFK